MQTADLALSIIGMMFFASAVVFSGVKLTKYFKKIKKKEIVSKIKIGACILLLGLAVLFLLKGNLMAISASLILGGTLIVLAYHNMKRFISAYKNNQNRAWLLFPNAFILLLFDLVALVIADRVNANFVFYVGNYLSISGVGDILGAVYENTNATEQ